MPAAIPSVVQLKRAIKIAEQIQKLEAELATLLGQSQADARNVISLIQKSGEALVKKPRKPYTFSPEVQARRAAAKQKTA